MNAHNRLITVILSTLLVTSCATSYSGENALGAGPINPKTNPIGAGLQLQNNPSYVETGQVQTNANAAISAAATRFRVGAKDSFDLTR